MTSQLIFFIFKNIWDLDKDKVKELFSLGYKLDEKEREELVVKAVTYIQEYYPNFSWNIFVEAEAEAGKEVKREGRINLIQDKGGIMSLLEQRLEREREKGLKKGMSLLEQRLEREREKGLKKGMSLLEQRLERERKKSLQEGLQKGQNQVILNMLKEKADLSFISKVTGLSEAEINKLKKKDSH